MKDIICNSLLGMILIVLVGCQEANSQPPDVKQSQAVQVSVCFTPGGQCTQKIVNAINQAKSDIKVQAYSFTAVPIAKALVEAKHRHIDVKVILDKSQFRAEKYSSSRFLANQGIPVWIDYKPAIAHNKIMIIDNQIVITGSFNFSKAAQEKNAENLLLIKDTSLAKIYTQYWQERLINSKLLSEYDSNKQSKRYNSISSW